MKRHIEELYRLTPEGAFQRARNEPGSVQNMFEHDDALNECHESIFFTCLVEHCVKSIRSGGAQFHGHQIGDKKLTVAVLCCFIIFLTDMILKQLSSLTVSQNGFE